MRWVFPIAILSILPLSACGPSATGSRQAVTLTTADGWHLPADIYLPGNATTPGVICLHRYGAGRGDWTQFASRAQALGYAVITLDLRGHGESQRAAGETPNYRQINAHGWKAAVADVRAAKQALLEAGADPENVVLAGEGLGASIALHYASLDDSMQAVIMVSPRLKDGGIDSESLIERLSERPVLLLATEDDAAAYGAATVLDQSAGGFCELRIYPGSATGTDLFAVNQNALELTLQWLGTVAGAGNATE